MPGPRDRRSGGGGGGGGGRRREEEEEPVASTSSAAGAPPSDSSDEEGGDVDSDRDSVASVASSIGGLSIFRPGVVDTSSSSDETDDNDLERTRAKLHDMIDTCQELEERQGFEASEDQRLRKQVTKSAKIFETSFMPESNLMERSRTIWRKSVSRSNSRSHSNESILQGVESSLIQQSTLDPDTENSQLSNTTNRSSSKRKRKTLQSSQSSRNSSVKIENITPSTMFLSYKHTNMCAQLFRKRTDVIGCEDSTMSPEAYLAGLKAFAVKGGDGLMGDYDMKMYQLVNEPWKTAPALPTMVGAFDHKEFLDKETTLVENPVKKEYKKRAKQFDPDTLVATQQEVNITKQASEAKSKANDEKEKALRKILSNYSKSNNKEAVGLYEFVLNKTDMRESLNNMFGVAFGVRDGTIALKMEDNQLKITPAKTSKAEESLSNRRQCIISISAAQMRGLQAEATGENVIKKSQTSTDG